MDLKRRRAFTKLKRTTEEFGENSLKSQHEYYKSQIQVPKTALRTFQDSNLKYFFDRNDNDQNFFFSY